MGESNPEQKRPSQLEKKPQDRDSVVKKLGEAAIKAAQKKK